MKKSWEFLSHLTRQKEHQRRRNSVLTNPKESMQEGGVWNPSRLSQGVNSLSSKWPNQPPRQLSHAKLHWKHGNIKMIECKNNRSEGNTENPVTLLSKPSAHTCSRCWIQLHSPPFSAERDEKTREERWETKALGRERTFETRSCFMGEKRKRPCFLKRGGAETYDNI